MNQVDRNQTLLQLQVSLPKRVILTVLIMAMLIMFVFFFNIPNPNMILIAGLVICSALFGYGGGQVRNPRAPWHAGRARAFRPGPRRAEV